MPDLDQLLQRLEELTTELESLSPQVNEQVVELLDGVEALHRMGMNRLADALDPMDLDRLRSADPAIAWLFDLYGIGVDQAAAAEEALEPVRPYIASHGGQVDVLGVDEGMVRLRLSGACAGCTASAVTLQGQVEEALAEGVPGYRGMEVTEDEAPPHPPPQPVSVELGPSRRPSLS